MNDDRLLAGAGRADITPPGDCILDGFAARDHGAEGIHDNLYATAVALTRKGKTAVIVGLDLLELSDGHMDSIWRRAKESFDLDPDQLFLNCSHTHAAPIVRPRFNKKFCPEGGWCWPDEEYVGRMLDGILEAIGIALDSRKPSKVSWGTGETHIGIYRRSRDTSVYKGPATGYIGIYANFPNPHKEIDRTCPVLLVTANDGSPTALLFGAGCHPTTMSHPNYLVSAEFPGAARRILESEFDGALSIFVQGIGGDIKPKRVALENRFRSGDFGDVDEVGRELAEDVMDTVKGGLKPLDLHIRSSLGRFPLHFAEGWNRETYETFLGEEQPPHRRNWAKMWLDKISRGEEPPESMDITLSILELSPALRLCGIAGELLTDMGLKIKRHFKDGTTLPCGYTNGRVGYIPDSKVLREGGYEAVETIFFTNGMPAPWREDIDETILGAFDELHENLH